MLTRNAIFGAVIGKDVVNSGNGAVHFDKALSDSGGTWGLTYVNQTGSTGSGAGSTLMFTGDRTISWQEI